MRHVLNSITSQYSYIQMPVIQQGSTKREDSLQNLLGIYKSLNDQQTELLTTRQSIIIVGR